MSFLMMAGIAVGLSMDALSVAMAVSVRLRGVSRRQIFRLAYHFGLFQAMMPVIGWAAGRTFEAYIEAWDHWIAFGLLAGIGGKALFEALHGGPDTASSPVDPTRGLSLVILSIATSIDALAVGISFAVLQVNIWYPAAVIGVITATLTGLGMVFGSRLGERFGKRIEIAGGLVLIAIGLKILIEHTLFS
jgi:manganese efflux pump family protein